MNTVNIGDVKKLVRHSLAFAVLMNNEELEAVVGTFMEVLDHRRRLWRAGGDQDR